MLADGTADFLHDRILSGPHAAIDNLTYEQLPKGGYRITGGTATWEGQDLETCQQQINEWDCPPSSEKPSRKSRTAGACGSMSIFAILRIQIYPIWLMGKCGGDPAVTSTNDSDNNGIVAGGIDGDGLIYKIFSDERIDSPVGVIKRAILKAIELRFNVVGIETDQGGDTWRSVYYQSWTEILNDEDISYIIDIETAVSRDDIDTKDYNEKELSRFDAFLFRDDEWQP